MGWGVRVSWDSSALVRRRRPSWSLFVYLSECSHGIDCQLAFEIRFVGQHLHRLALTLLAFVLPMYAHRFCTILESSPVSSPSLNELIPNPQFGIGQNTPFL